MVLLLLHLVLQVESWQPFIPFHGSSSSLGKNVSMSVSIYIQMDGWMDGWTLSWGFVFSRAKYVYVYISVYI